MSNLCCTIRYHSCDKAMFVCLVRIEGFSHSTRGVLTGERSWYVDPPHLFLVCSILDVQSHLG